MARSGFCFIPENILDRTESVLAGREAMHLWLAMWTGSRRLKTDGVWHRVQIARLNVSSWNKDLDKLLEHGLCVPIEGDPDSVLLVDWPIWNESEEARAQRLQRDRARKRGTAKAAADST